MRAAMAIAAPPPRSTQASRGDAQVEPSDRQPDAEVGQVDHDRILAGEEQLGEQPDRVLEECGEGRLGVGTGIGQPRVGRRHQQHRAQDGHCGGDPEKSHRWEAQQRDREQEQHGVELQDPVDPVGVAEVSQRETDRPDQDGPDREPGRRPDALPSVDTPATAGQERQAHPGDEDEHRRRPPAGHHVGDGRIVVVVERPEDMRRDHPDQRETPGDVNADHPRLTVGDGGVGAGHSVRRGYTRSFQHLCR